MNRTLHTAGNAQRILQITADTMLLIDRKGICVDIDTHSNLWFLQEDILLGKNILELLPECTREKFLPTFETVWREQQSISKNFKLEIGEETHYFKCIMHPFDEMVLCQYRDITQRSNVKRLLEQANSDLRETQKEHLRYEAQIKRLNQIMDTTIDNLPAGIVIKDINNDFRYIYRNRESYNRDLYNSDAIGKNDFDYYPPEIANAKRKEDIEVATTGNGLHWTTEGKDKNGKMIILDKRKIRVSGSEWTSPIVISIEWDITELEIMKRELQTSKEKAEMSDKLKSTFLANMSHEIRTPLNAIVGFSHLIAESENAEERKTYYDIVEANNERLLQLINEILDLSKIEAGIVEFTYSPISLNGLCREVYDAHIFRTPQGVKLVYEPSEERLVIETDKNRVFQVISNLIGNAFKFTKEGSISYGYALKDGMIEFHVTDTGTGIEPEKIGRVFERFAKLNNIAQGTGLGLSICKTIIERMGGTISVSSVIGEGTTFLFTLPYQQTQEQAELTAPKETLTGSMSSMNKKPKGAGANGLKMTILIAEDTDSNFDLLNAILGRTYKLLRARDGMEAVTIFDEAKPDLILMNIKMPNLDGLEATKIIRELSPTVPIIAQSAYAFPHDRKEAEVAGCNDFISKPISQKILKDIINKWLPSTHGDKMTK